MGVMIGQGNAVSPVSDSLHFFFALHQFDQQFMIYNYLKSYFEKNQCQDHGSGKGYIVHPAPNQCISFL